jgi:hypothetical protein
MRVGRRLAERSVEYTRHANKFDRRFSRRCLVPRNTRVQPMPIANSRWFYITLGSSAKTPRHKKKKTTKKRKNEKKNAQTA